MLHVHADYPVGPARCRTPDVELRVASAADEAAFVYRGLDDQQLAAERDKTTNFFLDRSKVSTLQI